jgi:hypothetical protein
MLNGIGRNNPPYMYFDSPEFTNAPGRISNGITSGFHDESPSTTCFPTDKRALTMTGGGVNSGFRHAA